jgi:hypothetical protein
MRHAAGITPRLNWFFFIAALALALTGCVSQERLHAEDEAQCTGYGFKPGTTDFANSMQRENLARQYWLDQSVMWGPGPWGLWGPGWGPMWAPYPNEMTSRPFENPFDGGFGRDSSLGCGPQRRSDAWPDGRI